MRHVEKVERLYKILSILKLQEFGNENGGVYLHGT